MTNKEYEEELAVRIITDYLKEEKNIEIKNVRHLTQAGEDPPDFYFEIGSDKIGCEMTHFDFIDELSKEEGNNLAKEEAIRREIIEKNKTKPTRNRNPAIYLDYELFYNTANRHFKKCRKDSKCNHNNAQGFNQTKQNIHTGQPRKILQIIHRQRHIKHRDFIHRLARRGKYR